MTDRRNRISLAAFGLLLAVGGALSAALGEGVFGTGRSNRDVFDGTTVSWWNEGGWKSFATVVAIGMVLFLAGAFAALRQLRANDGRSHTPTVVYPPSDPRGMTTLRARALSSAFKSDLERLADIEHANVKLFGNYPSIEMRAVLTVADTVSVDDLHRQVDDALGRFETAATVRPDPVQVTVRFRAANTERRQLR